MLTCCVVKVLLFIPFALGNRPAIKSPDPAIKSSDRKAVKSPDHKANPHHNSVTKKQDLRLNINKPKITNITKSLLRSSIRPSSSYKGNNSQTTTPEHPVADDKEEIEKITEEILSPSLHDKKSSLLHDDIHLLTEKVNSAGSGTKVCNVAMSNKLSDYISQITYTHQDYISQITCAVW